jgi:hypothetical protein
MPARAFGAVDTGTTSNADLTKMPALLDVTSCLFVLTFACSSQKLTVDQDSGAPDPSPDMVSTGPIWTDQSRAIDVSCFGFFEGSERIRATRDQLSDEQLRNLSALTLTAPRDQCPTDATACSVAITAANGSVVTYRSIALDGACGHPGQVITFESLVPFVQSVPCLSAKQGLRVTSDGGPTIPSVVPDAICFNGVFTVPPETVQRFTHGYLDPMASPCCRSEPP